MEFTLGKKLARVASGPFRTKCPIMSNVFNIEFVLF